MALSGCLALLPTQLPSLLPLPVDGRGPALVDDGFVAKGEPNEVVLRVCMTFECERGAYEVAFVDIHFLAHVAVEGVDGMLVLADFDVDVGQ